MENTWITHGYDKESPTENGLTPNPCHRNSAAADGFWRGKVSDRKRTETMRNLRPKTDSGTEKRDPRHGNSPAADGFWRGNVCDGKRSENMDDTWNNTLVTHR